MRAEHLPMPCDYIISQAMSDPFNLSLQESPPYIHKGTLKQDLINKLSLYSHSVPFPTLLYPTGSTNHHLKQYPFSFCVLLFVLSDSGVLAFVYYIIVSLRSLFVF